MPFFVGGADMEEQQLPEPLVPAGTDVRNLDGFFLNVERLMASELVALSSHEVVGAALLLWCRAWKQYPAASLPDDDRTIAAFAKMPIARFKKLRNQVMRGFVKCSDGRWYHKVLAADALEAFKRRIKKKQDQDRDAERLRKWRENKKGNGGETPPETPYETRFVRKGQDETRQDRTGQDETLSPLTPPSRPLAVTPPPTTQEEHTQRPGLLGEIIQAWNQHAGCLPVTMISPFQSANLLALTRAVPEQGKLAWWVEMFRRIGREMPYLQGKNNRGWRADLGWIVDGENWPNVINGRYCDKSPPAGSSGFRPETERAMTEFEELVNQQSAGKGGP